MFAQQKFVFAQKSAAADTAALNKPAEHISAVKAPEPSPVLKQEGSLYNRVIEVRKPAEQADSTEEKAAESSFEPERTKISNFSAQKNDEAEKIKDVSAEIVEDDNLPTPIFVGEAFATYVIMEVGKKLLLIDKHAAHEPNSF